MVVFNDDGRVDSKVFWICTAYEQGVGKGFQSFGSDKTFVNNYSSEWGCDEAWQLGYEEGRLQAEGLKKQLASAGLEKSDPQWNEFCRPFVLFNGSHELPNYPAICRAVVRLMTGGKEGWDD